MKYHIPAFFLMLLLAFPLLCAGGTVTEALKLSIRDSVVIMDRYATRWRLPGVVVEKGYILAPTPAIRIRQRYFFETISGKRFYASLRCHDCLSGFSLFETTCRDLTPIRLASGCQAGDLIVMIGDNQNNFPYYFEGNVSAASNQYLMLNLLSSFRGTSGDLVLNTKGELVGAFGKTCAKMQEILQAKLDVHLGGYGMNIALPACRIQRIFQDLKKYGKVRRGMLGVVVDRTEAGIAIQEVLPASPAEKAGLQPGDVITAFNGKTITSIDELVFKIRSTQPGFPARLTILRGNQQLDVQVRLHQINYQFDFELDEDIDPQELQLFLKMA